MIEFFCGAALGYLLFKYVRVKVINKRDFNNGFDPSYLGGNRVSDFDFRNHVRPLGGYLPTTLGGGGSWIRNFDCQGQVEYLDVRGRIHDDT